MVTRNSLVRNPRKMTDKFDHKVLGKSNNLLSRPINEENTYGMRNLSILETKIHPGLS